jgi:hypothetical protein
MKYRVHRFEMRTTRDQDRLEQFPNGLRGDVVAIIPKVSSFLADFCHGDFVLVVEKVHGVESGRG